MVTTIFLFEYFMFKKSYTDKIHEAEAAIARLEEERTLAVENNAADNAWIKVFEQYRNLEQLERKTIVELVEKILVYNDGSIRIVFKYQDEFEKHMKMMGENGAWQGKAEKM